MVRTFLEVMVFRLDCATLSRSLAGQKVKGHLLDCLGEHTLTPWSDAAQWCLCDRVKTLVEFQKRSIVALKSSKTLHEIFIDINYYCKTGRGLQGTNRTLCFCKSTALITQVAPYKNVSGLLEKTSSTSWKKHKTSMTTKPKIMVTIFTSH